MIVLDICLSDIPKDKIKTGTNGKRYIKLTLSEMRQADRWGNTHTLYVTQTKEEREARADRQWVGKGVDYSRKDEGSNGGSNSNDFPF